VDGLALLYCLALTQVHAVAADLSARPEEAKQMCEVVVKWVGRLSDDDVGDVLLDADVGEMIWSILLTASYTAASPDLLRECASTILQRLDSPIEAKQTPYLTFALEFLTGLFAAAGRSEEEIAEVHASMQESDPWDLTVECTSTVWVGFRP
jgi:hypothetical protein